MGQLGVLTCTEEAQVINTELRDERRVVADPAHLCLATICERCKLANCWVIRGQVSMCESSFVTLPWSCMHIMEIMTSDLCMIMYEFVFLRAKNIISDCICLICNLLKVREWYWYCISLHSRSSRALTLIYTIVPPFGKKWYFLLPQSIVGL